MQRPLGQIASMPATGQKRVLADDRSKAIQLVMLARLLKRVVEIDLEHCPNCGGELKIIAAILEQPVIERILTHLGLQARAPPRSPARGQALQAA
jgi:uncharacterized protein with PIN domain